MREVIGVGRTVEQAIEQACEQLGVNREDTSYEIIDLPRKKMFGLFGSNVAKVKVFIQDEEEPKQEPVPQKKPVAKEVKKPAAQKQKTEQHKKHTADRQKSKQNSEPSLQPEIDMADVEVTDSKILAKIDTAKSFLQDTIIKMGIKDTSITVKNTANGTILLLDGQGLGAVIGRRGETLDAIQYLTGLVANKGDENYYRIVIDCQNYREKRIGTLHSLARKMSTKAISTGRNQRLEPMNPYERRLIHMAISEIAGVSSSSAGDEPARHVIIIPDNKSGNSGYRDNRSRGKGGYRGGGGRGSNSNNRKPYAKRPSAPTQKVVSENKNPPSDDAADTPLYSKIEL